MTLHTREHADVRLITALVRHQVRRPEQRVRVGASLRKVRERLTPGEFQRWLEEDVRLSAGHANELMALAAAATDDVLRPAELQ